jgi:hypothetical protein
MVLSYHQRRNLLSWQYALSEEAMQAAKKEAKKNKFERATTQTFVPVMKVEAARLLKAPDRRLNDF